MKKFLSTLLLTLLLACTINSESLWTDEAFSAFIASHRTLASCWATLVNGDSSDLQMVLYYLYLHGWTVLFGYSEIALRSSNLPFIVLYSSILVWASYRLFRSSWVWIIAALAPLAVSFSNETRAYFAVIALSLTCLTCLLAYLHSPSERERRLLTWIVLLAFLFGSGFHMLMLLAGPPMIVMLAVFYRADKRCLRWHDWKRPLIACTTLSLAFAGYFAWTFGRGATYRYARPDIRSMASVLYRFSGLSGYSPNRHFDIPFHDFIPAMALASIAFISGLVALRLAAAASENRVTFNALSFALATAVLQIFVLSFAVHQQIEYRHFSSLLPLLLLLVMSGLSVSGAGKLTAFAGVALGVTWLVSDARLLLSPDYRREDFRSAAKKSIELHNAANADIVFVMDPIGAAYYGLDVKGSQPCFPLIDSCQEGLAKVPWIKNVPADFGVFWSADRINTWISDHRRTKSAFILVISRSRHPTLMDSAWWPIIRARADAQLTPLHGFYVYLVPPAVSNP